MRLKLKLPIAISLMWPVGLMANSLVLFIKPIDVLFLLILAAYPRSIKIGKAYLILFSIFLAVGVLSAIRGFQEGASTNPTTIAFIYKYVFVLLMASTFYGVGTFGKNISGFYLISLVVLAIWTILYPVLILNGVIQGNFRPSFPFSDDYNVSDAHLLSFVLGVGFNSLLYLAGKRYVSNVMLWFSLPLLLIAIMLTGSRTGVVMVAVYVLVSASRILHICLSSYRLSRRIALAVAVFSFLLLCAALLFQGEIYDTFSKTVQRSINFNLTHDTSSSNRITLLFVAISEAIDGFPFGSGFVHTDAVFYDGIISIILAHFGFAGLFVFAIVTVGMILKVREVDRSLGAIAFVVLLGNLITEYALVSRGAVFSLGFIAYSYGLERAKMKSSNGSIRYSEKPDCDVLQPRKENRTAPGKRAH
jgi:hypothetical protein